MGRIVARWLAVLALVFIAIYGAMYLIASDASFSWAAFLTLIVGAGWMLARAGRTSRDGAWRTQDAHYGAAMFAAYHTSGQVNGSPDCGASSGFSGDCGGGF
jgi:hypothetical protein